MQRTSNAVIAQMVADAIYNDDRRDENGNHILSDVYERAKLWHLRLQGMKTSGNCGWYGDLPKMPLEEFLCHREPRCGILDFEAGDFVECHYSDGKTLVGVVRKTGMSPDGGGYANVMFPDGTMVSKHWDELSHSSVPKELVDLARAQILATRKCPLAEGVNDD